MIFPHALRNDSRSGVLSVTWSDGVEQRLGNALLRRNCRCADCKRLRLDSGLELAVAPHTTIVEIRLIGNYAAQFLFSDGHERGIFPWIYLKEFSNEK